MKKVTSFMLALCLQSFLFQPAIAKEERTALVPLPSLDDFTRGEDGWGFGLGLSIEYETAYEGSDEFNFELQPAGAVQWRKGNNIFYWAGEAIGWRGLRADTWLLEALVGFEEGREESDSDKGYLNGLGNIDEGLELVLQARHTFSVDWRYWLVSRLVASQNGHLGLFGVGRRFGSQLDGSGLEMNIVAVFHNREFANKGFGINAQQAAASGLNESLLSGGLRSVGMDLNYRYNINNNWQIYSEALFEYFSSEVRSSPIARSNYETEVGVGFIYIF